MTCHRRVLVLGAALLFALLYFSSHTERSWAKAKIDEGPKKLRTTHAVPIAASTPLEKLLPTAPRFSGKADLVTDIADVPETAFEALVPRSLSPEKVVEHYAHSISKIHHLNKTKTDGYMMALVGKRPDLAGLPFVFGSDCRQKEEQSKSFARAVAEVRTVMSQRVSVSIADVDHAAEIGSDAFWKLYRTATREESDDDKLPRILPARIGALMQVCGPSPFMRKGLARFLADTPQVEATRALARLAMFSPEEAVRQIAVDALKTRREKDYTDILRQGLRYPLPAVAQRAADAIVKLERNDLVPDLIALLDDDPRAPQMKEVDKKQVPVIRELVKINHHRNCMLCHAPVPLPQGPGSGDPDVTLPAGHRAVAIRVTRDVSNDLASLPGSRVDILVTTTGAQKKETTTGLMDDVLVVARSEPVAGAENAKRVVTVALLPEDAIKVAAAAERSVLTLVLRPARPTETEAAVFAIAAMPIPNMPLPAQDSGGYRSQTPDIVVRLDVTYLRQDFSMMLPVANADPWPEMQRFDFLVRTRQLSEEDAQALREEIRKAGPSPYRRLAHAALRQLTGRDVEPTAEGWRRVLSKTP